MVKGSSKSVEDRLLSPQLQKFAHSSLLQRSQTLLLGAVNLFWVISREEKDYRQEPNAIDPDTIRDLLVVADSIATSTGTKPLSMRQWQSIWRQIADGPTARLVTGPELTANNPILRVILSKVGDIQLSFYWLLTICSCYCL